MEIIKDTSGTLVFKGQMIASEIEALYAKVEPLVEEILSDAVLDLSEVDEIDIAGLQLILALKKSVESEGSFQINAISPPVRECISISGFEMILLEVA